MTAEYRYPLRWVRTWGFWGLVAATSLAGSVLMASLLLSGGLNALELVIFVLFVPTFAWITVPFWTAAFGFVLSVLRRHPLTLERLHAPGTAASAPTESIKARTALAMPICNEDPESVEQRLGLMARSLEALGATHEFDVHLLSDTHDDEIARREEFAWARLQGTHPTLAFHYRRRERNTGRKAGNLAEFCSRCRDDYRYMIVLDADSLMSGSTLRSLVRRMEANPRLALLQTVPLPTGQQTLFGRLVQFAAHLHAPLLATGLAFWQGDTANYWGHNAIIRLTPFRRHARLPVLPGRAPLGGAILSHDFVEAALLKRGGWQVALDPTLGGSWEEVPGTLPDFSRRDRRWAQGSLQHLRLLRMPGLHGLSRMHFVLGAMGYLSSVLWFAMLIAGTTWVLLSELGATSRLPQLLAEPGAGRIALPDGVSLLALTAALLFVPKALALGTGLRSRAPEFGGRVRLLASAVVELVLSVLLAPVFMIEHTRIVAGIVAGRAVGWHAQVRQGVMLSWHAAVRAAAPSMVVGVLWTLLILRVSPGFVVWMAPILVGLLLAAPLQRWTSSSSLGAHARRFGIFETCSAADLLRNNGVSFSSPRRRALPSRIPETTMFKAERALFDLQRGRPVLMRSGPAPEFPSETVVSAVPDVLVLAVEGLDEGRLNELRQMAPGMLSLIVTPYRASAMGSAEARTLVDGTHASTAAFAIPLEPIHTHDEIVALASQPAGAGEAPQLRAATQAEAAGLTLSHLARLLPAVLAVPVGRSTSGLLGRALLEGRVLEADAGQVLEFAQIARSRVVKIAEAPVPLPEAEDSRFTLFREEFGLAEHVAIQVGDPAHWPEAVPVRLHSACLTGDLFGSLRCDCGEQLRGSMSLFAARGGGVLLYLAQEGRGIGLGNKFRAYTLQGTGLDTIDADGMLGFGADERQYDVAVQILKALGIGQVELLTNNPEKVQALEDAGISVARRRALHGRLNRHNLPYVRAKVQRAGHWLRDMLSEPMAGD